MDSTANTGIIDFSTDSATSNTDVMDLDLDLELNINSDLDLDAKLPSPESTEICPHCGEANELNPALNADHIRGVGDPVACIQCGFPLYQGDR